MKTLDQLHAELLSHKLSLDVAVARDEIEVQAAQARVDLGLLDPAGLAREIYSFIPEINTHIFAIEDLEDRIHQLTCPAHFEELTD